MANVSFSDALLALKSGKKVKRAGWSDGQYMSIRNGAVGNEQDLVFGEDIIIPNIASHDVLADDWQIIE